MAKKDDEIKAFLDKYNQVRILKPNDQPLVQKIKQLNDVFLQEPKREELKKERSKQEEEKEEESPKKKKDDKKKKNREKERIYEEE